MKKKSRIRSEAAEASAENRAWLVYQSNSEWIARVDAKASILLAFQGVLLGFVVTLTDKGRPLARLCEWYEWVLAGCSILFLAVGLVVTVAAIAPRLRSQTRATVDDEDFLFFGVARRLDPSALEQSLDRTPLPMLARQIVITAEISSRKHLLVSWSAWLLLAGGLSLGGMLAVSNLA